MNISQTGTMGQGMVFIPLYAYSASGQGNWSFSAHGTALYQMSMNNSGGADGDNISYSIYFSQGTYTISLLHAVDTNYGIVDFYINGSEVASHDLYLNGGGLNVTTNLTGITVANNGLYEFKVMVDGKNASSSGYVVAFMAISLYRTA